MSSTAIFVAARVGPWRLRAAREISPADSVRLPQSAPPFIVSLMQAKQRTWTGGILAGGLPVVALIAMVLVLAILQLRWSARVSEAERARLEENLQRSTAGFQAAFARDLLGICQTFQASQPRDPKTVIGQLSDRYTLWRRIPHNAVLISDLYIWRKSSNTLWRFNLESRQFEPAPWPPELRTFPARPHADRGLLPAGQGAWLWDEEIPALIHPIYVTAGDRTTAQPRLYGYLVARFSSSNLEKDYLPNLGRRFFPQSNGFTFQLAEQNGASNPRVVYESPSLKNAAFFAHADNILPLLDNAITYRPVTAPGFKSQSAVVPSEQIHLSVSDASRWQIAVRHRSGSVGAAVLELRHRDLAVSIAVFAILLVSLILILIATRRARRLARQQMEFASGVSHELRTPIAVISSAAENLADGVVTDGDRIRNYGELIHRESQRLSGMVDHILDFARLDAAESHYQLAPIAVQTVVDSVLASEHAQIQATGISIETKFNSDLPLLLTNAAVLQQCLQNLLSNALKYGGAGGRIVIDASFAHEDGVDLLLTVRDFGAGIAPADLPHIYEPFYRADSVRDSQIPGTGLGLSVTRKLVHGLGGRITVDSAPGRGSAFTLHLPIASRPTAAAHARQATHIE